MNWGLKPAGCLSSVFLNNKTGYIHFYIIVSVIPRTIILIYLHTSPDFRSGYIIHWLLADGLLMQLSLSLVCVSLYCISIFISINLFVVSSIKIVHNLHHWLELSYCIYHSPPFFINKVFRIIQSHTYIFIIIPH